MRSYIVAFVLIAAHAFAGENPVPSGLFSDAQGLLCAILILALVFALALVVKLQSRQRALIDAQQHLHVLAQQIRNGEMPAWEDTQVTEIDEIGQSLLSFEQRLREKREKLRELNETMLRGMAQDAPAQLRNRMLRTMIEAMPVGVLIAEAPSGRILEGNRAIEKILRHPVIYSNSNADYNQWRAFHVDGRPVTPEEFPLTRALAGEESATLECKYKRGDETFTWISIIGAPIRDERDHIVAAIVAVTDIDDIKNVEAQRRAMNLELHHRVNNSLAMIQGVANVTARTAIDLASFRENFTDRIQCLSRLSTLLVKNSWERTPLRDVIATAVSCEGVARPNISIEGVEPVELRSEVALAVGMAVHELLSNATQFGSLSQAGGKVRLNWRLEEGASRMLLLCWSESGGPPVVTPARTGVGMFLLNKVLTRQLGGDVQLAFDPSGLRAEIRAAV